MGRGESGYRLGLYEKAMPGSMTIPEKMLCAAEFGYDYLELSIDETDEKLSRLDMTPHERRAMANLQFETGIRIGSICLSAHRKYPMGSPETGTRTRSLEILKKAVKLASDIGVRLIQLAGYDVYYETSTPETARFFEAGLSSSVEFAAGYGVILAFETMETPFMDTVAKAMRYVREVDSPYLQVYPDLGNCTNSAALYGHDVLSDIMTGRGHLAAMHLKETVPGRYREVRYGDGHVDFPSAIEAAASLGVRMFVTEFWDTSDVDFREQLSYSKDFIDRQFSLVPSFSRHLRNPGYSSHP
jgi:L-ribulose-5-phosphate 3-epimerase